MSEDNRRNRKLTGFSSKIVTVFAIILSLFELYTAGFGFFPNIIQYSIIVGLILFLALAVLPRYRREKFSHVPILDFVVMVAVLLVTAYTVLSYDRIIINPGNSNAVDRLIAVFLILVILESSRRALGWVFPVLIGGTLLYAFTGPFLPGIWAHRGFSSKIILETMYMTTNGIWGTIMGITVTVVAVFVIFGSILLHTGGGKTFIDISIWATGKATGGAAKMATLASGLFGTINGNGPANVATTGTFTIPMMKRVGFKPEFAAGIEAAAASGGQIMPPIMGAGAFVMAEILGIPYAKVATAAVIPALLYYLGVWATIHFSVLGGSSGRMQVDTTIKPREVLTAKRILPLLVPLTILIILLILGYTPAFAAFWASFGAVILYLSFSRSNKELKQRFWDCVKAIEEGGRGLIIIGVLIASAQIIVTLINLTGLGVKISQILLSLSGGNTAITLILTMIICVLMGMGIPTVGAYVLVASVAAPSLIQLGLEPITAHMFVFYYAVLSAITPPVAPSVFVAASIAEANWIKAAKVAVMMGLAGFIVPYAFVYSPALLLQGSFMSIIKASISGVIGVIALAAAVSGFFVRRALVWQRALLVLGSIMLLEPSFFGDMLGYLTIFGVGFWQYFFRRKQDINDAKVNTAN